MRRREADEEGAGRAEDQRIANVGRGLGDSLGADCATGASTILDNDLLAQTLAQRLGEEAAGQVGIAAGRERHHEADRLVGVTRLRERTAGRQSGQQGSEGRASLERLHFVKAPVSVLKVAA